MKRKNKATNWIRVENVVKDTFDGEPIPFADFCKAVGAVARDLELSENDVYTVTVDDCGLRRGYCLLSGHHIFVDYCLEGNSILETVAHELRHAWQIKYGLFTNEERPDFDILNDSDFDAYENRPSEIDARNYAESFVYKYAQ